MNLLLERLKGIVETQRRQGYADIVIINSLKEYLQYAVLDFVYHDAKYAKLVMYGGTLLRICYELPRMSEDLDFQSAVPLDMSVFKEDLEQYFIKKYDMRVEVRVKELKGVGTETATIVFPILQELGITGQWKVLKLRFDVNTFEYLENFRIETVPKVKDTFAFAIRTYSLSTLMASKIAAVLLRTKRGIAGEMSDCKPRDIYDLMWYMDQGIMPDIKYIRLKGIEVKNQLVLFNTIEERVAQIDDALFAKDLGQFFYRMDLYENWYTRWRERFLSLRNQYQIYEVENLVRIGCVTDGMADCRYFHFAFNALPKRVITFTCILTLSWYYHAGTQNIVRNKDLEEKISADHTDKREEKDLQYITIFYEKIMDYLQRNEHIVLQKQTQTKHICYFPGNRDTHTCILLDEQSLQSVRLEEIL